MWAADCVWLQPCSLRWPKRCAERFHPHLSADRLQRILDLPATRSDPDGFRFGTRTRNALRAIWKRRRNEEDRQQVLDFIAARLAEAEPEDRESTGHVVWEAICERFFLESKPNHSPRRLAELAQLVGPYVQESLHDFRVGPGPAGDERTVLAADCGDPKSQQYLASISDQLDIPFYRRLPLARWQRAVLGSLAAAASVCLLALLGTLLNPKTEYWEIAQASEGPYELHGVSADGEDSRLGIWGQGWTATRPVPSAGRAYRVACRGQPSELTVSFTYDSGQAIAISAATNAQPAQQPAWTKFVLIPPGTFVMGSPESEPGRHEDEQQHTVTLTRGFWLAQTEVTQRQYLEVMGEQSEPLPTSRA